MFRLPSLAYGWAKVISTKKENKIMEKSLECNCCIEHLRKENKRLEKEIRLLKQSQETLLEHLGILYYKRR